jgi:hypothetical protein
LEDIMQSDKKILEQMSAPKLKLDFAANLQQSKIL